jgi:type I restriction enzyme, S subunit
VSIATHNGELSRSKLFPGDVLMNIVGPPLGKIAILPKDFSEWNMNQALAVFRPLKAVFNRYLYYMLSSVYTLRAVFEDTRGTAGQDNISLEQCRNLLIPIPLLAEQKRIVAKVDELMTLCDQLKTRLSDSQTTQIHLADAIVEQAIA